jgi:hypothetical protein
MSKEKNTHRPFKITYLEQLLKEEGFLPRIDEDGDLVFKSEGKTMFIPADSNDEEFLRISLPNFWSIDSDEERDAAAMVCCKVNKTVKVAKVCIVEDNVWASVELFASPIQSVHDVFLRCITVLNLAVAEFRREMVSLANSENFESEYESDEDLS